MSIEKQRTGSLVIMSDKTGSPLDRLEKLLGHQFKLLTRGDIEGAMGCVPAVQKSYSSIRGNPVPGDMPQINRILELHKKITLAMAVGKDELSRRIARVGQGRKVIAVYRS